VQDREATAKFKTRHHQELFYRGDNNFRN
jgi:hypothetical protein